MRSQISFWRRSYNVVTTIRFCSRDLLSEQWTSAVETRRKTRNKLLKWLPNSEEINSSLLSIITLAVTLTLGGVGISVLLLIYLLIYLGCVRLTLFRNENKWNNPEFLFS